MSALNDKQRAYAAAVLNERAARGEFGAAQKESLELELTLSPMEREDVHIALAEDPSIALEHWHKFDAEQEAEREALRQEVRTETVTAIVATLRQRAEVLHHLAGDDTLPYPQGLVHYSVAQELERAAEAIEQAAKEGT